MNKDLFDQIPEGLFSPLAAPRRRLYWRVLERLYKSLFDEEIEISDFGQPRGTVIDVIEAVLDESKSMWFDDPGDESQDDSLRGRANSTYYALRDSGWFEEERRAYQDFVSMPPRVNQCLTSLIELSEGRALVMTGKLKSLQASLDAVLSSPSENADTLAEVAKEAGRFSRHLNSIRGSIKALYDQIRGDIPARDIVNAFFDDFLRQILIRDYATIKTSENPLAVRDRLLGMVSQLRYSAEAHADLLEGYRRIYPDETECDVRLDQDLSRLEQVFLNLERQLDSIDAMKIRYEQRIDTVIDYATRSHRTLGRDLQRIANAVVSNAHLLQTTGVLSPFVHSELYGEERFAAARRNRPAPAPRSLKKKEVSPEVLERIRLEREAKKAMQIDDDILSEYINRHLDSHRTIELPSLIVRNVRDYFCVLALLRVARAPRQAKRRYPRTFEQYALTPSTDMVESEYFRAHNVVITRRSA